MELFAAYTFGQVLLSILEFALLCLWIYVVIRVVVNVFESSDLSGWSKAGWLLLIILVPLLGVVIYLVARGDKLSTHARQQDDRHVRRAGGSGVDDIAELERLKDRGVISEEDFQRARQKARA